MSNQTKDDFSDAFYARGNALRSEFGQWDCCSPVAHAILTLVEAENELAKAFDEDSYGPDGSSGIKAALAKRRAAAEQLLDAINEHEAWF
jgi:hypothetical protein